MTVSTQASPYRGLAPFEDSPLDALLFFGREREREIIVANLIASRLTVLYGPSGVGKTSLLRAGVAQQLRSLADASVVMFSSWAEESTAEIDGAITGAEGRDVYLILDQIEEYFLYRGKEDALGRRLPELLTTPGLRVNVLLGVREDALAKLDFFKGRVPNLFSNYLRLDHLDRSAARDAILGPLQRLGELHDERYAAEPALVETVLDQVATGQIEYGLAGRGTAKGRDEPARIEAPFLQLVLERLWDVERGEGSPTLRLVTLERLGGAQTVVRDHLERALAQLDPTQRALAAEVFDHLVTPSGTKIAHDLGDLAGYARADREDLEDVLLRLSRERIVRRLDDSGGESRYEIFHDVLAGGVLAWRTAFEAEQELARERIRRRRAVAIASVALLALAAVAAIALFALSQRARAEDEARNARARELSARAVAALASDPQQALRFAAAAAREEPTVRAEDLLRRVLLEARQRAVLPAAPNASLVAFAGGGRLLVPTPAGVRMYSPTGRAAVRLPLRSRGLVAISADDRLALNVEGVDAVVRDTSSGRVVSRLRHTGAVRTGAFDPRGRFVATVALNRAGREQLRLFRLRSGRLVYVFAPRGMKSVAFSRDGRLVAAGSADKTARVWRVADRQLLRTLAPHNDDVVALTFDPQGRSIATASNDGGVRVWELATGARTFFFPGHTNPVTAVDWSDDGSFLADASLDGTSRILQVAGIEEGSIRVRLVGHSAGLRSVAFRNDGRRIATLAADGSVRVWDARAEQRLDVAFLLRSKPIGATYGRDGRWIVGVGEGCVTIATRVGLRVRRSCRGDAIRVARLDRGGEKLLVAGSGRTFVEPVAGGSQLELRHRGRVNDGAFFANGGMVTASEDGWARVFDRRGRLVAHLDHGEPVDRLAVRGDRLVATATRSGGVRVWRSGGTSLSLSGHVGRVTSLEFSPDGGELLTAGADGAARVWDVASGALRLELGGHSFGASDAAYSPDGRTIATSSFAKQVRLWNADSGRLTHDLVGHFGAVNSVAFSPDARWLVTTSALAAALWSTRTGELFEYLRGHTKPVVRSAEFSPDGREVLTSGDDGTVRTYDCELCGGLDALLAIADRRLAIAGRPATARSAVRRAPRSSG